MFKKPLSGILTLCILFCFALLNFSSCKKGDGIIRVLAIGNSFSQNAVTYLRDIAAADGIKMEVANLYLGACSLEMHWQNASEDIKAYTLNKFYSTTESENDVSIKYALESKPWDFVVMQQVSQYSGMYETYQPYLTNLSEYVKSITPDATQLIHQTWAYEIDSNHGGFANYGYNQQTMFLAIKDAYNKAAESINAKIIPCGEAMQKARATAPFDYANNGKSLCADGYHANAMGSYLLGAVWYEVITGKSILENTFTIPELSETELNTLKQAAHDAVDEYRDK